MKLARSALPALMAMATVVSGCSSSDSRPTATAARTESAPVTTTAPTIGPTATSNPDAAPSSLVVFQTKRGVELILPDGSEQRLAVPEAPSGQEHPDWSPDGTKLSFDVDFTTVWTANADGTDAAVLFKCLAPCAVAQDSAWSPDGTEVAFMVAESDGVVTTRAAIVAVNVDTGDQRTLYEDTSGVVWLYGPRWSPDGESIVLEQDTFASNRFDETRVLSAAVLVVPLNGRDEPSSVAEWAGPLVSPSAPAPDWSPDGDLIVFSRRGNLFTVHPDGTGESQLSEFDGLSEHAIQPTFTPDGNGIVFTYVTGRFGVDDAPTAAIIPIDGGAATVIANGVRISHPRLQP